MDASNSTSTPPAFPVGLHEAFGAPLVGTWLNAALLMLSMVQLWAYLEDIPSSKSWCSWKRWLSLIMLVLDIAGSASACWLAYTDVVVKWGRVDAMTTANAALPVLVVTTTLNLATSHAFLILRYFRLTRRRLVTLILGVFSVAALASGIALVVACAALYPGIDNKRMIGPFVLAWTIGIVVACMLLVTGLVLRTWDATPTSEQGAELKRRGRTIRFVSTATSSGLLTTIVATAQLIVYLASRDTNLYLVFTMCLGRTCTITVHFNLNANSNSRCEPFDSTGTRSSFRFGKATAPNPFEETRLASEVLRDPHRQQRRQSSVHASISLPREGAPVSLHRLECRPEVTSDVAERGLEKGADITGAESDVVKGLAL